MSQTVDFSIETLTIPISVSEVIYLQDFLNNNPSITELSVCSLKFDGLYNQLQYPMLDLAPSSLPRLSRLECPMCLIADLVPGRPLKSIKINSRMLGGLRSLEDVGRDEKRTLSVLKRSTAAITILQVPGDVYAAASFHRLFPQLETLILDIPLDLELDPEVSWLDNRKRVTLQIPRSDSSLSTKYAQNGHIHHPLIVCISTSGPRQSGILISHFNSQLCPESHRHFPPSYLCVSPTK
jgi:hypothetical protein